MAAVRRQKERPKVILRRCSSTGPEIAGRILEECFSELGASISGKVLIKPNVVTANKSYIHHSFTHPCVTEALIGAVRKSASVNQITVGESSAFGMPPGLFAHEAGYDVMCRRLGVRLLDFNEDRADWTPLEKGIIHEGFHVARSILEADTLIWAPKLKYHICCQITNALKLNVGILQHRDRMKFHDDRLNDKIVDLLEVGYPDVIVSDAVTIGHGFESAPQGFNLGLLMVADDPLAIDAVAAEILGYRPEDVVHLRKASERGYGSIDLKDFDISGDVSVDELRAATAHIESEYQDIHKVKTPIQFFCGNAPDRNEFCYGGCLAAVKGCLGTIDKRRPGSVRNARPGAIVTGVYDGDVVLPGLPVLLVGDCTKVTGKLEAGKTKHLKGCPIGAANLLLVAPSFFKMPSPMADIRDAGLFIYYSLRHLLRKIPLLFSK